MNSAGHRHASSADRIGQELHELRSPLLDDPPAHSLTTNRTNEGDHTGDGNSQPQVMIRQLLERGHAAR